VRLLKGCRCTIAVLAANKATPSQSAPFQEATIGLLRSHNDTVVVIVGVVDFFQHLQLRESRLRHRATAILLTYHSGILRLRNMELDNIA